MSVNTSSSSNDSFLHPNLSSIYSFFTPLINCIITKPSGLIYGAFNLIRISILLPLCILVLYLGLQRWRKQRSTSSAATTSHSDIFTYHMVAVELVGVFGYIFFCSNTYRGHFIVLLVGYCLFTFTWYSETFFHILTCVERYLAVVHPITYLSLRNERGIRIRNFSIGCIWLLSIGATSLVVLKNVVIILDLSLLISSLIVISFCSLSVLCVLIRPGPAEQGGGRERVDQSKQRAFYTIVAILVVLLLRCAWNLMWVVSNVLNGSGECLTIMFEVWFNLPSSLVLPLLFLHRAGTLSCCKTTK